jgi:hypothetical protein
LPDAILEYLNRIERELTNKQLKVGFIDGATYPDGTPVSQVAFNNEYGVPEKRQPPRPFFRNAIADHQDEWKDAIGRGIRAGLPVNIVLEQIGALAASDVYTSITQLVDPPISSRTIRERQERGNMSVKPLIDTKVMINSVSYEVKDLDGTE